MFFGLEQSLGSSWFVGTKFEWKSSYSEKCTVRSRSYTYSAVAVVMTDDDDDDDDASRTHTRKNTSNTHVYITHLNRIKCS